MTQGDSPFSIQSRLVKSSPAKFLPVLNEELSQIHRIKVRGYTRLERFEHPWLKVYIGGAIKRLSESQNSISLSEENTALLYAESH